MNFKYTAYLYLVLHVSYSMVMSRSLVGRGMDTDENAVDGEQKFQKEVPRQLGEIIFRARTGNAAKFEGPSAKSNAGKSEGPESICGLPDPGPDSGPGPVPGPGPGPGSGPGPVP